MKAKKAENDTSRGFSLGSGFDGLRRPLEEHQRAVTGTGDARQVVCHTSRVLATGDFLLYKLEVSTKRSKGCTG